MLEPPRAKASGFKLADETNRQEAIFCT